MKFAVSPLVRRQFEERAQWYEHYRGKDFVKSFAQNIFSTYRAIAQMPTIGRIEQKGKRATYRSFLAHPGCRIYYVHDQTLIRIQRLHFSAMETPPSTLNRN
ncbi:MAG: type II toxin-antitoxin system RelE/ParE family toxin [Bacteroidaceae bacterium]|nr:type II toxin-antitoxin system RelE/ParE family toxin [Bacteroidaceae bacterium]